MLVQEEEKEKFSPAKVYIESISPVGQVNITFSKPIRTFPKEWINTTNTDIWIKVTRARLMKEGFDLNSLNFTWRVEEFEPWYIMIQLDFNDPVELSPDLVQD